MYYGERRVRKANSARQTTEQKPLQSRTIQHSSSQTSSQQPSLALQRFADHEPVNQANADPAGAASLSSGDVLYLQRAVGNRAVAQMLGRPQQPNSVEPINRAKHDRYEQEAERTASTITRHSDRSRHGRKPTQLASPSAMTIQRTSQGAGVQVDAKLEASIRREKGGGRPLDDRTRSKMGQVMGQNFDDVRIHSNPKANQLNRSLNAKAFTTGRDIFFREGEYNPQSSAGKHLLAHELTHVAQQRGSTPSIQRVEVSEDENGKSRYTSSAMSGAKITQERGVITAVSGKQSWGGHAWVYMEFLQGGHPVTISTDISGVHEDDYEKETPNIMIRDVQNDPDIMPMFRRNPRKRSWVVNWKQINAAYAKAKELQSQQDSTRYTHSGGGLFGRVLLGKKRNRGKKILNCARYARDVIRAAGISVNSGRFFHTPTELVLGKKFKKNAFKPQKPRVGWKSWIKSKFSSSSPTTTAPTPTTAPTTTSAPTTDPMEDIMNGLQSDFQFGGSSSSSTSTSSAPTSSPAPEVDPMEDIMNGLQSDFRFGGSEPTPSQEVDDESPTPVGNSEDVDPMEDILADLAGPLGLADEDGLFS